MKCLACGSDMRTPGSDPMGHDQFWVRHRKCDTCEALYETHEKIDCVIEQHIEGPLRSVKANSCPVCTARTMVIKTIALDRGRVLRTRQCGCMDCATEFGTVETVSRMTVPVKAEGELLRC